jgi:hypothetical protein
MHATVCLALVVVALLPAVPAHGMAITATPSRSSVQRGSVFDMRMEITTRAPVDDVTIVSLVPSGFRLYPVAAPGVKVRSTGNVLHIGHVGADSSLMLLFRAWPPTFWGKPHDDGSPAGNAAANDRTQTWLGISTKEPKTFAFNVFYTEDENGTKVRRSQDVTTSVTYTTHFYLYMLSGLIGTLMGHLVKNGIDKRAELSRALRDEGGSRKLARWLRELFGTNVSGLITIIVIGFATLLVLAKDGLPVAAWYQAVALGIGLALVTDDQLLARFAAH